MPDVGARSIVKMENVLQINDTGVRTALMRWT